MKNKVSLVNFVRGCEPRYPRDLYTPVAEEIKTDKEYGLPHTFLLQYDALLREDMRELFNRERDESMELGVWFEMGRELTEKVGIEWRGRPGYDWDWYVNPGFLMAYTCEQRRALIDEVFRLFREVFGEYPRVAGSWLLDSYSASYMSEKYGMKAFCICREQYAVDAYTLWGGYYSGGYYPSKNNLLCPSQSPDTRIKTPVFRMLGADPIYCYDEKKYSPRLSAYTLEPCWASGQDAGVVSWYLKEYFENPSVSGSFLTTGQENSFSWSATSKGYPIQAEQLSSLVKSGKLSCEKLGDIGKAFSESFAETPPSALSAFSDWSDNGNQSVWFSCKNYRANLFNNNGRLFFRDIQKFDDSYKERYLCTPCVDWAATYDNLPVIDGRIWSGDGRECALSYNGKIKEIKPVSDKNGTLVISVSDDCGDCCTVTFTETAIKLDGMEKWTLDTGTSPDFIKCADGTLYYRHNDFGYSVIISPAPEGEEKAYGVQSKAEIKML